MEDNLLLLEELVSSECSSVIRAKSATLGNLQTKIGGNQKKLRRFEHRLRHLLDLKASGEDAAARIIAVLRTLKEMKRGMEGIDTGIDGCSGPGPQAT